MTSAGFEPTSMWFLKFALLWKPQLRSLSRDNCIDFLPLPPPLSPSLSLSLSRGRREACHELDFNRPSSFNFNVSTIEFRRAWFQEPGEINRNFRIQNYSYSSFLLLLLCWRRLHNEKLHSLYRSPNIVRVLWTGHVARMEKNRRALKILSVIHTGNSPLGRPRCRDRKSVV